MGLMHLLLVNVLTAALTTAFAAASTTRVVVPDIAGMIFPSFSVSQHVQFGDPSSRFSMASEFVAPSADSLVCDSTRLCLEVQVSSIFQLDPFFLHQYDANPPVVSATFDGYNPKDILPMIPGSNAEATRWWFQTNGSTTDDTPTTMDLLLRLRQRSQRWSARDQLLVQIRVEVLDSRTVTSSIQVHGDYGNQRLTHSTHRVNFNVVRVALSITKDSGKRDVVPSDAYPLVGAHSSDSVDTLGATGGSCDACYGFLDSCSDIEPCKTVVLPCLLSRLEEMADADTNSSKGENSRGDDAAEGSGPGSFGGADSDSNTDDLEAWYAEVYDDNGIMDRKDSTAASTNRLDADSGSSRSDTSAQSTSGSNNIKQEDFFKPLAACVANLPSPVWLPIRQAIFCLAGSKCPLGTTLGNAAGEEYPTFIRLTNGSQRFSVAPAIMGTNNVNLTIAIQDIRGGVTDQQTFSYIAPAPHLGMYLRSFVLLQAAKVSVLVDTSATESNMLELSLTYSDTLMLTSVNFYTASGQVPMLENSPAQAVVEYPSSSPRPALNFILDELRARINPTSDLSDASNLWIQGDKCVSCSAMLFGCTSAEVANKSCNYNTMRNTFGQCIQQQLPPTVYDGIMNAAASERQVTTEISRCFDESASTIEPIETSANANSALACFAQSKCPFGPTALVQNAHAIVLETSSYIQLVRMSGFSENFCIKIEYKLEEVFMATTARICVTSSKYQIEQIIKAALETTGIDASVSISSGDEAEFERTVKIIYQYVFFSDAFTMNARADTNVAGSGAVTQIVMEGGPSHLLRVPRDSSKIFKPSELEPTSPSGNLALNDVCRKCAKAIHRCHNDSICASYLQEVFVPSLRATDTTQAKPSWNSLGQLQYEFDLAPTIQCSVPTNFGAWDAFAAVLLCLAEVECDLEYSNVVVKPSGGHHPTYLRLTDILVKLFVRTYSNTKWTVNISKSTFAYEPVSARGAAESADNFLEWIKMTVTKHLPGINVQLSDNWMIESTGTAVGTIVLYGQFDQLINRFVMAPISALPTFSVSQESTNHLTGFPAAGISEALWSLSLMSVGSRPRYNKFLDLLKFGIDINNNTDDTTTTSAGYISPTDQCRNCKTITSKCQRDEACMKFSREVFVPFLRNVSEQPAMVTLSDNQGNARFAFSFGGDLYAQASAKLHSLESWGAIATELSCLARRCDLEYSDMLVPGKRIHEPSYLSIDRPAIMLQVTTYNDTEWSMAINGSVMKYAPRAQLSPYDAAVEFRDWITAQVTLGRGNLTVTGGNEIKVTRWSAAFNVTLDYPLDGSVSGNALAISDLVPRFDTTGGRIYDKAYSSRARVDLVPWELSLWAVNHTPQYSKLLELLAFGFIRDLTLDISESPTLEAPDGIGVHNTLNAMRV